MGINIRYFTITIISIFLALGVGIFIGFMFDAQEILASEREDLIEALNEKFLALELENKSHEEKITALINENKSFKAFSEYIFPELIENRLADISVGFIQLDNEYSYSDIMDIISMAGGKVIPINSTDAIKNDFTFNHHSDKDFEEVYNDVYDIDYYIIAGGSKDINNNTLDTIRSSLITGLAVSKSNIIAVEKKAVEFTYVEWFKNNNFTTIDNVDSISGKISLILTLDKSTKDNETKLIIDRLLNCTIDNYNEGE